MFVSEEQIQASAVKAWVLNSPMAFARLWRCHGGLNPSRYPMQELVSSFSCGDQMEHAMEQQPGARTSKQH